jgi:hypothetical protein
VNSRLSHFLFPLAHRHPFIERMVSASSVFERVFFSQPKLNSHFPISIRVYCSCSNFATVEGLAVEPEPPGVFFLYLALHPGMYIGERERPDTVLVISSVQATHWFLFPSMIGCEVIAKYRLVARLCYVIKIRREFTIARSTKKQNHRWTNSCKTIKCSSWKMNCYESEPKNLHACSRSPCSGPCTRKQIRVAAGAWFLDFVRRFRILGARVAQC